MVLVSSEPAVRATSYLAVGTAAIILQRGAVMIDQLASVAACGIDPSLTRKVIVAAIIGLRKLTPEVAETVAASIWSRRHPDLPWDRVHLDTRALYCREARAIVNALVDAILKG